MLAHWCIDLDFDPLVSYAMSRAMSRGSCGLRKSLGSLSALGWDYIPTQLAVWPEVSQLCCCWVGPGLGSNLPRWQLPAALFSG